MRWRGNRQSQNIEDERGVNSSSMGASGGGGGGGLLRLLPIIYRFLGLKKK